MSERNRNVLRLVTQDKFRRVFGGLEGKLRERVLQRIGRELEKNRELLAANTVA